MWEHGHDWGFMGNWGGAWWGPFGMIIWLLFLVAIVVAVVWLLRATTLGGGREPPPPRRAVGLDILEERYARGEIDRNEYLQKKQDLTG
jgi:putative membrane protein